MDLQSIQIDKFEEIKNPDIGSMSQTKIITHKNVILMKNLSVFSLSEQYFLGTARPYSDMFICTS